MIHPDLQKLLDYALQNGSISEKQREILHKKAIDLGEDVDLLEMVIEGEIQKQQKAEEADNAEEPKQQDNFNCPNCGATIPRSSIKCGFCAFEITRSKLTGGNFIKNLENRIRELENKHTEIQAALSAKQVFLGAGDPNRTELTASIFSAISTFSMPNDKQHLIEFFYFCDSNYKSYLATSSPDKVFFLIKRDRMPDQKNSFKLASAFYSKAKMVLAKIEQYSDDSDIQNLLNNFKTQYDKPFEG